MKNPASRSPLSVISCRAGAQRFPGADTVVGLFADVVAWTRAKPRVSTAKFAPGRRRMAGIRRHAPVRAAIESEHVEERNPSHLSRGTVSWDIVTTSAAQKLARQKAKKASETFLRAKTREL